MILAFFSQGLHVPIKTVVIPIGGFTSPAYRDHLKIFIIVSAGTVVSWMALSDGTDG